MVLCISCHKIVEHEQRRHTQGLLDLGGGYRKGYRRGSDTHSAKLTEFQVIEIRRRAKVGEQLRALAREFGISCGTVGSLVKGDTWRHLAGASPEINRKKGPPRINGEKNHRASITDAKALAIIRKLEEGVRPPEIARHLGVSRAIVYGIKYKKSWTHLSL